MTESGEDALQQPLISTSRGQQPPAATARNNARLGSDSASETTEAEIPKHIQVILSRLDRLFGGLVVVATLTYLIGSCILMSGMRLEDSSSVAFSPLRNFVAYSPAMLPLPVLGIGLFASCFFLVSAAPLALQLYQEYPPARTLVRAFLLGIRQESQQSREGLYQDWQDLKATVCHRVLRCRVYLFSREIDKEEQGLELEAV